MRSLILAAVVALPLVFPGGAVAATGTKAGQPFPTNLFTVPDASQITGLRVDLPKPDCATHPSDCADIDVLDTLDGFNIQPRISIPFSAPIDLSTVSSSTVFLVGPGGHVVGINQAVWEPLTNTLHAESDEQLAQNTTYLLVVTRGVRGADGMPLEATDFRHDLNFGQTKDLDTKAYRQQLLEALPMAMAGGATPNEIAAASLFTTQSVDAISRQIRSQLRAGPASFTLGAAGERTVFPLPSVAGIQLRRQTGTTTFVTTFLPTPALAIFPGSVGAIGFGSYASPNYENGDGAFDSTEGVSAVGAQSLIGSRDGLRQTTIDLMQLVKVVRGGVDVDGDGSPDLSGSRIYYAGQSFGGIYGVELLGLEPDIHAGVANVPGGPIIEIARLSPNFRPLVGISLITRTPSLYNAAPNSSFTSFVENIPLRNKPLVPATVPGASAIQAVIDNTEWAQQAANPAAYAPFVTRPVIIQFARGDKTVPNPTATALLRAGKLASRATIFRNDLAFAANPAVNKNPHTFLTSVSGAGASYALAAQHQIAAFFASDGAITVDPDGPGPFFETPTSMLPEDLAFIP